jgi:hypothetical protein
MLRNINPKKYVSALVFALPLLAFAGSPAFPQVGPTEDSPRPPCVEKQPTDVLSAWAISPVAGQSGHDAMEARAHPLLIGTPNKVSLVTLASAHFPVPPGGAEQPKQYIYAGILAFHVPKNGKYRVVTDEGMRIDVVAGGTIAESVAFGRGPACSGKFVDFDLAAGDAVLQLYGAPYETVTVLVLPHG